MKLVSRVKRVRTTPSRPLMWGHGLSIHSMMPSCPLMWGHGLFIHKITLQTPLCFSLEIPQVLRDLGNNPVGKQLRYMAPFIPWICWLLEESPLYPLRLRFSPKMAAISVLCLGPGRGGPWMTGEVVRCTWLSESYLYIHILTCTG